MIPLNTNNDSNTFDPHTANLSVLTLAVANDLLDRLVTNGNSFDKDKFTEMGGNAVTRNLFTAALNDARG